MKPSWFLFKKFIILQNKHTSLPLCDGRGVSKRELLGTITYQIMWKPLEKANFRAVEILKENHASFIIAMRGKLQRLQHRDWSNLCLAEKIILWVEFGGDVFMSALTLRKPTHSSFSGLLLLVFPFSREKLFALDALHALLKMKSSETYIQTGKLLLK